MIDTDTKQGKADAHSCGGSQSQETFKDRLHQALSNLVEL